MGVSEGRRRWDKTSNSVVLQGADYLEVRFTNDINPGKILSNLNFYRHIHTEEPYL